jgi:hypothetical protein
VQVSDQVRKCVCFVLYRRKGEVKLAGTAFFVGSKVGPPVPPDTPVYGWGAVVTARHVIDGIREKSDDGQAILRLNDQDTPTSSTITSPVDDWIMHRDGAVVDVCALPFIPPLDRFDHRVYLLDQVVDDQLIYDEQISVGDEVFLPGLFHHHPGSERNIPIVRIGNIAAMPEEPVSTELGPMDAYLIESRSIRGLSGSPVFVNLGPARKTPERPPFTLQRQTVYLLGVMHGHWDVPTSDPLMGAVNMGIAIVPPISRAVEILENAEEFQVMKEKAKENTAREGLPTADSLTEGQSEFENFEIPRHDV